MFVIPNLIINMKQLLLTTILMVCTLVTAQVGINTTDSQSTLDIRAINTVAPLHIDGILIPRISNLPATNPIIDQKAMLVYTTKDNYKVSYVTFAVPLIQKKTTRSYRYTV